MAERSWQLESASSQGNNKNFHASDAQSLSAKAQLGTSHLDTEDPQRDAAVGLGARHEVGPAVSQVTSQQRP